MEIELIQKSENPQSAHWQWGGVLCEDGESTMERDRKLFEEVKKNGGASILRFYSWKEPTLSFGRTQGIDAETFSKCAKEGWKIVQRLTGGGKVFHKNDLCFSLIWRRQDRTIPWGIKDSYCAIHKWVKESLSLCEIQTDLYLGLDSRTIPQSGASGNDKVGDICFQSPVENDLMCDGKKIVGGAQWRDGNVALHQGSIQILPAKLDLEIFKQKFGEMFSVQFIYCLPTIFSGLRKKASLLLRTRPSSCIRS